VCLTSKNRARLGQGKCPTHTRVGGVPLSVTDDIQGRVKLGHGKCTPHPRVGGLLL
jgi:hypothetical protein